jgi:hypothetical protein
MRMPATGDSAQPICSTRFLTSLASSPEDVPARWGIWPARGTTSHRFLTSQLCSDDACTLCVVVFHNAQNQVESSRWGRTQPPCARPRILMGIGLLDIPPPREWTIVCTPASARTRGRGKRPSAESSGPRQTEFQNSSRGRSSTHPTSDRGTIWGVYPIAQILQLVQIMVV